MTTTKREFVCPNCKTEDICEYNEMMKKPPYCLKCGRLTVPKP